MSDQRDQGADAASTRRARFLEHADVRQVPLRTIFASVATVAVVYIGAMVLYRLRELLMLMLVGGFVALVLNPVVEMLQHWKIHRRGVAVSIVAFLSLVIFIGLAVTFGYPLVNGLTHLANALPSYVRRAQLGKGAIGHLLRQYHVEAWITKNSSKLISLAKGLSKPALALGRGAVSVMFAMIMVYAFVILLLLEAPKMRELLFSILSPRWVHRVSRVSAKVSRAAAGYVLGNILTSLMAGLVVFVTLSALSVPFPFIWALWVALVDILPTIGGALAGIPTVLFALGHSLTAGIVTFVVFMVYTQLENHVLNPVIMSRTVKLNPLTVFVAVLVGAEFGAWIGGLFGGFIGVLLAVPAAATFQVIIVDVWNSTKSSSPQPPESDHSPGAS